MSIHNLVVHFAFYPEKPGDPNSSEEIEILHVLIDRHEVPVDRAIVQKLEEALTQIKQKVRQK